MKKILMVLLTIFCFASPAIAGDGQALSQQAMADIEQQAREMSTFGVPEAQAKNMLTQMVQSHFESRIMNQARQEVVNAARAGLPTEPMMNKALEGIAKKASPQEVVAAMQAVRGRYAHAHQVARSLSLDTRNIGRMTQAVADSLAAGMKVADLEAVSTQLQAQQQTQNPAQNEALALQTMQTVRTMAQLGIRSKDVADTVCQALRNQYTERHMEQMRHQVAEQSRQMSRQQMANQFSTGRQGSSAGQGGMRGGSDAGSGGSGSGSGGSGGGGCGGGGGGGGR